MLSLMVFPSAMMTLIAMLSAEGSGLAVLDETELEREGMMAIAAMQV